MKTKSLHKKRGERDKLKGFCYKNYYTANTRGMNKQDNAEITQEPCVTCMKYNERVIKCIQKALTHTLGSIL